MLRMSAEFRRQAAQSIAGEYMITTKTLQPCDGEMQTIKGRAAFLVQAFEGCPLELTLETLSKFDKWNSPSTKSRSAKRWIRQFCGFESEVSSKVMNPTIEVVQDGRQVTDCTEQNRIMKEM